MSRKATLSRILKGHREALKEDWEIIRASAAGNSTDADVKRYYRAVDRFLPHMNLIQAVLEYADQLREEDEKANQDKRKLKELQKAYVALSQQVSQNHINEIERQQEVINKRNRALKGCKRVIEQLQEENELLKKKLAIRQFLQERKELSNGSISGLQSPQPQ